MNLLGKALIGAAVVIFIQLISQTKSCRIVAHIREVNAVIKIVSAYHPLLAVEKP